MMAAEDLVGKLPIGGKDVGNAEEMLNILLRNISQKYSKQTFSDSSFHHSKVNTIAKTSDIIRQLNDGQSSLYDDETYERQRKEDAQQRKRAAKQRLGNLYGEAANTASRLKGKQVTLHGDEQDFEYEDVDVETVKIKVEACPLLTGIGGTALEMSVPDNVISILDLRYMLKIEYRLKLTLKQTAALIGLIDRMVSSHTCMIGKGHNAAVSLQRFLVGLKLLTEELRSIDRSMRRLGVADRREKEDERIRNLEPDREVQGPVYLSDLLEGLQKISKAAQRTCRMEPKYFHKMCNAYSCLEGSVDGMILKDFCRDNLHCKLTSSEASAIMKHADRVGLGCIAMDYFLRQIKIEALGKKSIFSPLTHEIAADQTIVASSQSVNIDTTCSAGNSVATNSVSGRVLNFSLPRAGRSDDDISVMSQLSEYSSKSPSKVAATSWSVNSKTSQLSIPIPPSLMGINRPLKDHFPSFEPQPAFNYNRHAPTAIHLPLGDSHSHSHNHSHKKSCVHGSRTSDTVLSAMTTDSIKSANSSATGHVSFYSKPSVEYKVNLRGDLLSTKDSFYNAINFFKKCTDDDRKDKNELLWRSDNSKKLASSSSRLDKFQRVPTSLGYEIKSGGGAMIVRPRDPIGLARPVGSDDVDNITKVHARLDPIISPIKSTRKSSNNDKKNGKMIGGMDLDNPVRDLDMKRWLHETFSRLPLDQKGALLRYQKRWPLLGGIVTVMKKMKVSVDEVIQKMKTNFINSNRPFLKINDALADIGFWLDRQCVTEVLDKENLVRGNKYAQLFFSSLDPRKKGCVASFEIAALLAVLLHLPWASPWSSSDSTFAPVTATQIVDCLLRAAAEEFLGVIPQVIIDSALLCICTSYQAEDAMIELLSPVLTKMKSSTCVLQSPNPSLKGALVRVVEKMDVLRAVESSKVLCEHIELQFRLATVTAASN